jgi:mono/diheme cytochrome c family protein
VRPNATGFRSRRSMLETLVRHLDMVRLTVAASMLAMIGCTGLIDAPPPTKAEIARQVWIDQALPAMRAVETNCVICHGGASPRPMEEFLVGTDDLAIRDSLLKFDPSVISLDAPQSSRILNKGQHEGPPLVGQQKSDVQAWIQAEKDAANDPTTGGGGTLGLKTDPFTFSLCTSGTVGSPTCPVNELPLDNLGAGAGIPGAKITFVVQGVGSGLYLNNLKLVPGAMGAYIEHPLFVSIPADPMAKPIADTFDRFFNVKQNLMANATADQQQLGGGTAAFVNFPPENKIAIFFKAAKIFQPDAGGGGGATGCKVLTSFETNARGQLNTNCASCHAGGNGGATSAVDMTGIGAPNAMNACNQVKLRMLLTDLPNSSLFVTTDPGGNAVHPFKFGGNAATFTTFKNSVTQWGIAERDAP